MIKSPIQDDSEKLISELIDALDDMRDKLLNYSLMIRDAPLVVDSETRRPKDDFGTGTSSSAYLKNHHYH